MAAEGYYGNLTPPQQDALQALRKEAATQIADLGFEPEHLKLWNVPVDDLGAEGDLTKGQTVILLKFLRAREFKVADAVKMLVGTLKWRKEFNMTSLPTETFDPIFTNLGTIHGFDKHNSPITWNFYTHIGSPEVANNPQNFLRWRIQLHEKAIALLDINNPSTTVETITQVHDYSTTGLSLDKRLKATSKEIINIFQEYYPEFLEKKFFLGVPVYLEFLFNVFGSLVSKRTSSKFVMVGKRGTRAALLNQIPPGQLLPQYGGFTTPSSSGTDVHELDAVTRLDIPARQFRVVTVSVKPGSTVHYEFTTIADDINFSYGFRSTTEGDAAAAAAPVSSENPADGVLGSEERVESTKGSVKAEKEAFVMKFNNSFSYLTAKEVMYHVYTTTTAGSEGTPAETSAST